jgi:hypothetical protein
MPDFIAQLAASYRGPKNGRGNQHLSVHAKLPYRWSRHTRLEPSPLAGPIRHLAGIDHNLAGGRRTDEQSRLGEVQPGPARHSARPVSVLHDDDGDGRVVIEVAGEPTIRWSLYRRPRWRSALRRVPTQRAYASLAGHGHGRGRPVGWALVTFKARSTST